MNVPVPIRYLTEITNHIRDYFGDNSFVLHEKESSTVHVDVHVVRPTAERPFFTLLTSGMSDLDMRVSDSVQDFALAEVCLCLPSDWPLAPDNFEWRAPEFFWPIKILKEAARYAHRENTWLCWGHTIGGEEPIDAQVDYTGVVFLEPMTFPEGAERVKTRDRRHINYLALIPLFRDEILYARQEGSEALAEKLYEAKVCELLSPHRPGVL
jgi:hypothetical protein